MKSQHEGDLLTAAQEWADHDPDPVTRNEILNCLERGDFDRLSELFQAHLTFGTAGIRGKLGPGPTRMNRVAIRRLAFGLATYLHSSGTIVIGHDSRHNSSSFAQDICDVLTSEGIDVSIFSFPVPTPVLAYSVRYAKADLGVMVTASHNPALDNGCKVFLSDGAQLRSPIDKEIDQLIQTGGLPPLTIPQGEGTLTQLNSEIWEAYCQTIASSVREGTPDLRVAYTPLHGVAWKTIKSVFERSNTATLIPVSEQVEPDPDFPTVPFPNPEEEGVMDLLLDLAVSRDADLAMANDPDGDRLAAAIPTQSGQWRVLTGDEIGALLFDRLTETTKGEKRKVVSTLVCSSLVSKIAARKEIRHAETLTGFKWIIPEAYRDPSFTPIFCYEEALGYATNGAVRDKDGISAALLLAEVASDCRNHGESINDRLNRLSVDYGHHVVATRRVRLEGGVTTNNLHSAMQGLRQHPIKSLAGMQIVRLVDYEQPDSHPQIPPANLLKYELERDMRILVRPSGTEPMIKIYMEKVTPISSIDFIDDSEQQAQKMFEEAGAELEEILRLQATMD